MKASLAPFKFLEILKDTSTTRISHFIDGIICRYLDIDSAHKIIVCRKTYRR
jgi:hypothetical protein